MNSARLLELADVIEKGRPDMGFDMGYCILQKDGGTLGCIALWGSVHANNYDVATLPSYISFSYIAGKWLGLDWRQRQSLFCPSGWNSETWSREDAVATLRHAAYTGKIVWDKALKDSYRRPTKAEVLADWEKLRSLRTPEDIDA